MQHVLVSACLLGVPVRHNGADVASDSEILQRWIQDGRVIAVCPEVDGGLPARRPPAEVSDAAGGNGVLAGTARVFAKTGNDVTREFVAGAERVAEIARLHGIRLAILKEGSPSCGSSFTYDGSFAGVRIRGPGVTAARLVKAGIRVFSETQLAEAELFLTQAEAEDGLEPALNGVIQRGNTASQ